MKPVPCWAVIGTTAILVAAAGGAYLARDDRRVEIAAAIEPIVAAGPTGSLSPDIWKVVRNFYPAGSGPAWVSALSTENADRALAAIENAVAHGLRPEDYGWPELARELGRLEDENEVGRLAAFDVRLTAALLTLGHDVAVGRTPEEALRNGWKKQRPVPDLAGTLRSAGGDLDGWLEAMQPSHPQYARLRHALKTLVAPDDADTAAVVATNLERWRWMPDDLGDNYLFVNIPSYELTAYEDGHPVLQMRVIVGKPDRRTPVLSSTMNTVVFSPYWHIPTSIAEDETVPKAVEDPEYLRRGGFEIVRVSKGGATPIDPEEIDWNDPDQLRQLSFRQRPGPQNALGYVKFLFPNPFNVYLHDTPGDTLFGRTRRAFSHGCIRLEDPQKLAEYVLRHDRRWDEPRIIGAMHSGNEQNVKLDRTAPLQVHIVYFTAWVSDDERAIAFYPDVYKYDGSGRRPAAGIPAYR